MTSTAPARRGNGNANPNLSGLQLQHGGPDRVGQGTAIEQSRAAAEVFASVLAAKECPRNETRAMERMEQSCRMQSLSERAFFRFSRGGGQVNGKSVHLARELARCWGNVQYGVSELRRDDGAMQSEMQAFAWDLESNTRPSAVFIVPHKRDKRGGPEALVDMRDIYENNANNGARRVREAIFNVLPIWFVEQAADLCRKTLEDGGDVPLPQRRSKSLKAFEGIGVSEQRLVDKLGKQVDRWIGGDLATLTVIYASIKNGEATVEDEFPTNPVTADEIRASRTPNRRNQQATTPTEQPAPSPEPAPDTTAPGPPATSDEDTVWEQILAMSPADWDTGRVEQDFQGFTKCSPAKADADTMRRYLTHLQGGA